MNGWQGFIQFINEAVNRSAKLVQSIGGTGLIQTLEKSC